jgi:acetyltransferase
MRYRLLSPLLTKPASLLTRLAQIDYDREMALVLLDGEDIIGISRLLADPDNTRAEIAVLVRGDLKGRGFGRLLLRRLVEYARGRGISVLAGEFPADNISMVSLCEELGFEITPVEEQGSLHATLTL